MLRKDDYHYGAVKVLCEVFDNISEYSPVEAIRALEAAGYKVVRPEPTREMMTTADGTYVPVFGAVLAGAICRAPTLTEQKP